MSRPTPTTLLTREMVTQRTTLGRSDIYRKMNNGGGFPRPLRIGHRTVRWLASEVDEWLEGWIATLPRSSGVAMNRAPRKSKVE